MGRRLDKPNRYGGTTDHSQEIAALRKVASLMLDDDLIIQLNLAADLLEAHDQTGISLDDWPWARRFVEGHTHTPVEPNCV